MYKLIKMSSGEMYIAEVVTETSDEMVLKTPLLVEHRYNEKQQPVFRYLPSQIISDDEAFHVSKAQIVFTSSPKEKLIEIYEKICTSFIPVEDEEFV